MNYSNFQQILDAHGLSNEPAFDDLFVEISPISPDEKGKIPLGLYYPDDKLIVLPPTLTYAPGSLGESVALHELGHRHGHYYWNDISEEYAENYRQSHQHGAVGYHEYHDLHSGVT